MVDSRRKGANGERAVAAWLRCNGHPHAARRGVGHSGPDIIGIPGVTLEVKTARTMELAAWIDQLVDQMTQADHQIGAVIHKRPRKTDVAEWYASMPVSVFAAMLQRVQSPSMNSDHQTKKDHR